MNRFGIGLLAAAAFAALPLAAAGQAAPELTGSGWVNQDGELSLERLRGKVVVLYFYEEG